MRVGRAGMISAVNRNQKNQQPKNKENQRPNSGYQERAFVDSEKLKRYRPQSAQNQNFQARRDLEDKPRDGHYDHHAEIAEQKRRMQEEDDRKLEMGSLGSSRMRKDTEDGIQKDQQFKEEYNNMERNLTNHHPYRGQLKVAGQKFQMGQDDEEIDLEQINIRESTDERLVFRRVPFVLWITGTIIIIFGLYLVYHLALGRLGVLFDGYREGHWWQYLLAILIVCFGVIFLNAGKVDTLVFDKNMGTMSKVQTSVFCKRTKTDWAIEQIRNVRVFKRGHDGVYNRTIRYEVQIDFEEIPSAVVIISQKKDKAMRQLTKIKDFCGIPLSPNDIKYIDESSSNFKR